MRLRNPDSSSLISALDFDVPLSSKVLNIEDKNRSNILTWRGQFSPQLVESLLAAYCSKGAAVLDPFSGSGTVIFEAAYFGASISYGVELNPSAWILSRIYQLTNLSHQEKELIENSVRLALFSQFPEPLALYGDNEIINIDVFKKKVGTIAARLLPNERIIFDGFIIILDIANHILTPKYIHDTYYKFTALIQRLPYLQNPIHTFLSDARQLPLTSDSIDFVLTSPPYINVFNYHQNYRRSAEMLDWNLLQVARSEIGSNRANRGNRFLTVIQYCLDMFAVFRELSRTCRKNARIILIVGYESNVLGVPFYNADILQRIACETNLFHLIQRQKREFRNKFGAVIREDLLHLQPNKLVVNNDALLMSVRNIAFEALVSGVSVVADKNAPLLQEALERIENVTGIPLFSEPKPSMRIIRSVT